MAPLFEDLAAAMKNRKCLTPDCQRAPETLVKRYCASCRLRKWLNRTDKGKKPPSRLGNVALTSSSSAEERSGSRSCSSGERREQPVQSCSEVPDPLRRVVLLRNILTEKPWEPRRPRSTSGNELGSGSNVPSASSSSNELDSGRSSKSGSTNVWHNWLGHNLKRGYKRVQPGANQGTEVTQGTEESEDGSN